MAQAPKIARRLRARTLGCTHNNKQITTPDQQTLTVENVRVKVDHRSSAGERRGERDGEAEDRAGIRSYELSALSSTQGKVSVARVLSSSSPGRLFRFRHCLRTTAFRVRSTARPDVANDLATSVIPTAVYEEDARPAEQALGRRDEIHPRGTVPRSAQRLAECVSFEAVRPRSSTYNSTAISAARSAPTSCAAGGAAAIVGCSEGVDRENIGESELVCVWRLLSLSLSTCDSSDEHKGQCVTGSGGGSRDAKNGSISRCMVIAWNGVFLEAPRSY